MMTNGFRHFVRRSHPKDLADEVLGFFAARQLGALLRALLRDEGTAAMKVLSVGLLGGWNKPQLFLVGLQNDIVDENSIQISELKPCCFCFSFH